MRILMLSDVYFPRVNGVSTSIKTFRDDLRELGHECTLVAPAYPHAPEIADDPGVVRIPSWRVPFDPEDRILIWPNLMGWAQTLAPGAYDIVHIQTPFTAHYAGLRVARRLGVPVVETYHTYFEHYLHHYVPAMPSPVTRAFARRVTVSQCHATDAVISPSIQMADALRAYGVRSPITVLPTGLPRSAFGAGERARFRAAHGIDEARPVALYVGRVAHEKNIDFLLHMLTHLRSHTPDVLLMIAGEGPAQPHIAKLAETLGVADSVRYLGYMDRARTLLDCYAAADVFVFASRTETQGLVLLEAMAQGTPVVSTAVMGTANVLAGLKGAAVAPEDAAAFARLTANVLANPDLRQRLSEAARIDAQAWTSRTMAERLAALYEEICNKSGVRLEAAA